ncbi:uncharacterized protein LOC127872725 isoform X1 [Dreissena polymorpha]|uniref:uncharacterized protein LOC127872725 isoform X1 n=3 Tax=Dreissena polymorpha TaxID=45954 RepID=UPI00226530D6|nr:uncharacterized protein LOC127872725 isoform X1 [Dreissena polymorpha]
MDRGRKPPQVAPVGTKKKMPVATAAKDHEPLTSSGLYGEMVDPSKDGNASKALRSDGLTFDPSLLVGPLYVPKTSTNERIKAQLGDITQKLHDTLYTFEETELEVTVEDPLVTMMKKQMDSIADSNVRHALATVMDQYNHMSEQVNAAYRDRDEMLLQLADWFTLDHLDLAEIKLSVDETEEANIKQSYFDTVTNFEKLKNLQQQINKNSKSGKPTKKLQAKKVEIENSVVDKFRVMKDMSIQTMKLKVADDAPWKDAAKEIVGMLKNVRSESADEMLAISKKMQNLFDQLDKQAFTIRSLSAELREKKEIAQKLTAENNDMAQDLAALRYRQSKYENDLSNAQQMIRQLHGQLLKEETHVKGVEPPQAPETLKQSISKLLAKIEEPETPVKKMASDPAMLRTQIRTYQEAMDGLREAFSNLAEEKEELMMELIEKKNYIENIEAENDKLVKSLHTLRNDRQRAASKPHVQFPKATTAADISLESPHEVDEVGQEQETGSPAVGDLNQEMIAALEKEVQKWKSRCENLKRTLAETEMKLSEAFREISDLRMMDHDAHPMLAHAPKVDQNIEKARPPGTVPVSDVKSTKPAKPAKTETSEKQPQAQQALQGTIEPKESPNQKMSVKPKPKQVKARYLEQKPPTEKLPPIQAPQEESQLEEAVRNELSSKQSRELKLFQAGDMQGKLNTLIMEIMEFITEVGRQLQGDRGDEEGNKIQAMKAFTFEQQQKKLKETKDAKEEEWRHKKSQVFFCGQTAVSKLREAFETLYSSLNLHHDEYEAIYRSFKITQQRNLLRKEILMGRIPVSALREFDRAQKKKIYESYGPDSLMAAYFNISYGTEIKDTFAGNRQMILSGEVRRKGSNHAEHSGSASDEEESEEKLKRTINVLRMQRSKSDLDVSRDQTKDISGMGLIGGAFFKEKSPLFHNSLGDREKLEGGPAPTSGQKQEMKLGVAVVPRKGLIALSTSDDTSDTVDAKRHPTNGTDPQLINFAQLHTPGTKSRQTTLIKRADIMVHVKAGAKLLEDAEQHQIQEEELEKNLENYTILDLQTEILGMTDPKAVRRTSPPLDGQNTDNTLTPRSKLGKREKPITLPAIKNINPFAMKT